MVLSCCYSHNVRPAIDVALTTTIRPCSNYGSITAQSHGVVNSSRHSYNVRPAINITLTIFIIPCSNHSSITAQSHGVIFSCSHGHNVRPAIDAAFTKSVIPRSNHGSIIAQPYGVAKPSCQCWLIADILAFGLLCFFRTVPEIQCGKSPHGLHIFSVIHQLLCSLIALRHLLQVAGLLCLVGAVIIAVQCVKGFCRCEVLAVIHQLLCSLIALRHLLQVAGLLCLVGAVFKTFQRVEGFRRRGIFFFVQQTLCFQICCLFRVVRCRHRLPYPQHTAAEQQNAHRNPHPFVGFLFFRRGSKAASVSFCGVGMQSAGLLVLAVVMKTSISTVRIARSRFVRPDGFVGIYWN